LDAHAEVLDSNPRTSTGAQFVHLADAKKTRRIAKGGILAVDTRIEGIRGFYCTPVSLDFYRTHQRLRELKRRGIKTFQAVPFQLAPNTWVWVGRYNQDHVKVTAAEAARVFHEHQDGLGLEVIVPKSLPNTSITRIFTPPQVAGWRFKPEAEGKKPFCGCRYCNRGEINAYRVITEERE
jgi:hypothetical protein